MKIKSVACLLWLAGTMSAPSYGDEVKKVFYVNKQLYNLYSVPLSELALREKAFGQKNQELLPEYKAASDRLSELSAIREDQLTPQQKREKTERTEKVRNLTDVLGPEVRQLEQESHELKMKSEIIYYRALKTIIDKTHADAIAVWNPAWYYLSEPYDITHTILEESTNKPWSKTLKPSESQLKNIYYVDQFRVKHNVYNDETDNANEFLIRFYQSCSEAGKIKNADLIIELNQSGYEIIGQDHDLSDEVINQMRKLSVKRHSPD